MQTTRVFCFPFAGGDFFSYRPFLKVAPSELQFMPVELPGRGKRISEPLVSDVKVIAQDIYRSMIPHIDKPYAIYGHSMGAIIAYLVTRIIVKEKKNRPVTMLLTGAMGPSVLKDEPVRHLMTYDELVIELRKLGGVPEEVLNNKNLMDFYSTILRSDFKAVETFDYKPEEPINIPITVITGTQEKITRDQAMTWKNETTGEFKFFQFPGDHFFIFDNPAEIVRRIYLDISRNTTLTKSFY